MQSGKLKLNKIKIASLDNLHLLKGGNIAAEGEGDTVQEKWFQSWFKNCDKGSGNDGVSCQQSACVHCPN